MLKTWNGELRLLSNFKFRRFGKVHLKDILQKVEKQSKLAINKSTSHTKSSACSQSSRNKEVEDTENSGTENKELNTTLPENITLNDCPMEIVE